MNLTSSLSIDILKVGRDSKKFIGRPFYLSYDTARLLVCDAWKAQVKGIPAGAFLLAFYDGENGVEEAVLLRALSQTKLPSDNDIISSMIEYYKDNMDISGRSGGDKNSRLDQFTRYEFSFSGLECRVLGVFYRNQNGKIEFGADLENFYSANNYSVYKPDGDVLEFIVNQRDDDGIAGQDSDFKIGKVRYSSSIRNQSECADINVWVNPKDFLGKRTAMFGMTRTGKSNTVKKIIEATEEISKKASFTLLNATNEQLEYTAYGTPTFPVGQIIFDVNGEYANANRQDSGTAIYDLYKDKVVRYSVLEKGNDFKVMKVNFYKEIESGFSLICNYFQEQGVSGDYVNNFSAVSFEKPESDNKFGSEWTRYHRLVAAYKCCLHRAGFKNNGDEKIYFTGASELNSTIIEGKVIDPKKGINIEQACIWFERIWEQYEEHEFFSSYISDRGHEWANDDLKSMLVFLTRYKSPGKKTQVSGYKKINVKQLLDLHTTSLDESFELQIPKFLQEGKIVIVDLSQGEPLVQRLFSEKICRSIFNMAMSKFIKNEHNNFVQFYFEEAHNLFPKKDDKDLSQIYNRIAKEGAKLHLGMIYATQEVSSISSNILKNTQNWFIAHLNNIDETKELEKYYDFKDFTDALVKFSATNDKGFVRMKTYTNPFIVPVQVDRFLANKGL
ncbi:ATP-binding protein [Klebsiella michiganensis]|uniref:ATP-binding protein n=1 Tax=Klebsiella michiganensis TaxID=1134687 RepID=UPI001914C8A7|nr:DUF87 domain-containing protein [Klebsiella michiganensis]